MGTESGAGLKRWEKSGPSFHQHADGTYVPVEDKEAWIQKEKDKKEDTEKPGFYTMAFDGDEEAKEVTEKKKKPPSVQGKDGLTLQELKEKREKMLNAMKA